MTARSAIDAEIGVLPGGLRGRPVPGAAALAVDAGTARFTAIDEGDLGQAPASLGPRSTLVAQIMMREALLASRWIVSEETR